LVVFDRYLWRLSFLHPWFVNVPDIGGVWKAMLSSTWVNPETGETIEPIMGYAVIRQTFSTLSIRLLTKESSSKLVASRIICDPDGVYSVVAVYINEPKHSVRGRSPIHYGGLVLHVQGKPPIVLDGHYWTDRATQGEVSLSDRRMAYPEDFEMAARTFQSANV
jgi:hypothetical protein